MTVVAIRGDTIAADTGLWEGDNLISHAEGKVFPCRHGAFVVVGYCVSYDVMRQLDDSEQLPTKLELPEGVTVILLGNDSYIHFYEHGLAHDPMRPDFYAFGAAAAVCLGAFHMGATAEQAVECAIKVGPWAAGSAMSVTLAYHTAGDDTASPEIGVLDIDSEVQVWNLRPYDHNGNSAEVAMRNAGWRERRGLR